MAQRYRRRVLQEQHCSGEEHHRWSLQRLLWRQRHQLQLQHVPAHHRQQHLQLRLRRQLGDVQLLQVLCIHLDVRPGKGEEYDRPSDQRIRSQRGRLRSVHARRRRGRSAGLCQPVRSSDTGLGRSIWRCEQSAAVQPAAGELAGWMPVAFQLGRRRSEQLADNV
jgi:hypothetical protein